MNPFTKKTDAELIDSYEKWFDFSMLLPRILAVITAIAAFISGIVYMSNDYTRIGAWIWVFGAIGALLTYFLLKLVLSGYYLIVLYLRKMSEGKKTKTNTNTNTNLPTI
ncbi:MAG: hypothetical protein IJX87_02950 [Clostridia bacterium]|nr:hypothetical protein [Clostridia bacterium]